MTTKQLFLRILDVLDKHASTTSEPYLHIDVQNLREDVEREYSDDEDERTA